MIGNQRQVKEKEYFEELRKKLGHLLILHDTIGGLMELDEEGRGWENVIDHCILEATRVKILAEKLNLPSEATEDLVAAATLHDFYKRREKEAMVVDRAEGGSGREGSEKARKAADQHLRNADIKESIIRLVNSVGAAPTELLQVDNILKTTDNISDADLALLVVHYVDGYTRNAEWVEAADLELGVNDVDRRAEGNIRKNGQMETLEAAEYQNHPLIKGRLVSEVGVELSHRIERLFTKEIKKRTGEAIHPLQIPEVIDRTLKAQIAS